MIFFRNVLVLLCLITFCKGKSLQKIYSFESIQNASQCSTMKCSDYNSYSFEVTTLDCSNDNNTILFDELSIDLLLPPHAFITAQYLELNVSTYYDQYSPPPKFSVVINNIAIQSTLLMDVWNDECDSCVVNKIFLLKPILSVTPFINGTNSILIKSLTNKICISDVTLHINYRVFSPFLLNIQPTLGPIDGGTEICLTGRLIYPEYQYECCFGTECTPFLFDNNQKGYCITPNNTGVQPVSLVFTNPELSGNSLIKSSVTFEYYNITLTSAEVVETNDVYYLDIHGEGFVDSMKAYCLVKNETTEILLLGKVQRDNIICLFTQEFDIDDVEGKTYNISISLNEIDYTTPIEIQIITPAPTPTNKTFGWITILVFFALGIALIVIVVLFLILLKRKNKTAEEVGFINPDDVVIENIIGNGSYGDVYSALWRGQEIAVKLIPTKNMLQDNVLQFTREVQMMKKFRHPCVLQFFGSGTDANFILIAMELMKRGSAHSLLMNKSTRISWERRLRMLKDCASGMFYLHSSTPPIIHLDLKSHNLLVDENWKVKVSDFGLSMTSVEGLKSNSLCGTLPWTSPEMLKGRPVGTKADVYSFAIVMWEFLSRSEPYPNIPRMHLIEKVGEIGLRPDIPQNNHLAFCDLMQRSWETLPEDRPDFSEIIVILDELIHDESSVLNNSLEEEYSTIDV